MERWKSIREFPGYSVSNTGLIRSEKSGRILALSENQYGLVCVGMVKDGIQHHRSVPLLVANAFVPRISDPFDTPINKDGNRHNNNDWNLVWRPRWYAVKYNRQFKHPYHHPIQEMVEDRASGEVFNNSWDCAIYHGLLEEDLVLSILNRTFVWPTYQEFQLYQE
jgi:hypothetical protein